MRETRQVKPPLQLQVAHPPDWLPEAHSAADLSKYLRSCETLCRCSTDAFVGTGRFGYHFPHPKQEEDILTETNVKDGLHLPTSVAVRLLYFVFWDILRISCLLGRNMGGIGNVSATLGDRYSRGARGPYEPSICSPCRGRRHTVRLLIVPFEDLTYNPPQTIYCPHTPTRHSQRCQETSMVRRPR